jgi:hypothetical protein
MSRLSRVLLVLAIVLPGGSALAGDPFAVQNNYEGLDHEGEKIQAIRIPLHITLRSWQERSFGLRLRLAATFATNDLYNILDEDFENVRMSSFVPGLEFVIPLGQNHLLLPYVDAGIGFESADKESAFLAAIGLRTEFIIAGEHYFAGFEPGFRLNSRAGKYAQDDLVFSPNLTVSGRRVLGFTISGHQPDAGVFFETGYDFNALELTSVSSTRDATSTKYEVGLGFGFSQSQPKIGPFRFPRIRIGYRFGDLEGWRLRIGGDWLNPVAGLKTLTP